MEQITELKRQGVGVRAISRLTGYDRKTVRKYLEASGGAPVYGPRSAAAPGKLDPHKPYLAERLQAGVWNAQVLPRQSRFEVAVPAHFLRTGVFEAHGGARRSFLARHRIANPL